MEWDGETMGTRQKWNVIVRREREREWSSVEAGFCN